MAKNRQCYSLAAWMCQSNPRQDDVFGKTKLKTLQKLKKRNTLYKEIKKIVKIAIIKLHLGSS